MTRTIQTTFTNYNFLETEDGSLTFYSEKYDENGHSTSGAYGETKYNYVEGCQVASKSRKKKPFRIYETGWGIGHGLKITLESKAAETKLEFYSCEIDRELVEFSLRENFPEFYKVGRFQEREGLYFFEGLFDHTKLVIFIGDIAESYPLLLESKVLPPIDAFFHDPFSPKKNPKLWTFEYFEFLLSISNEDAILSTYSASASVRKTLSYSGWNIISRKGFGLKRSTTLAFRNGKTDPDLLRQLMSEKIDILRL